MALYVKISEIDAFQAKITQLNYCLSRPDGIY